MTSRERVEIALRGGKPDRVPAAGIYDAGYMMRTLGHDIGYYQVMSADCWHDAIEKLFLRHPVDFYFVEHGTTDDWTDERIVEKHDGYWLVTEKQTGRRYRVLSGGGEAQADGTPVPRAPSHEGVSMIQSREDLENADIPSVIQDEYEAEGAYGPLRYMLEKYPGHHFCTQIRSPFVTAINVCGGYTEGLTTMASEPELFKELMQRCVPFSLQGIGAAKKAGAHSVLYTSYYSGADTISPKQYREFVLPYKQQVCQAYKDAGFFVIDWFLGDLMPLLDQVMELPIDALFLEQGRKGYVTDPVDIRKRVGPHFCLIGFGFEEDYIRFNREALTRELQRQISSAGGGGAFIAGTPIMPPDAQPAAVDFYFAEARRLGRYSFT